MVQEMLNNRKKSFWKKYVLYFTLPDWKGRGDTRHGGQVLRLLSPVSLTVQNHTFTMCYSVGGCLQESF